MSGIGTTISGMMGRGSIRHNNREFTAANVDRDRSGQNIVFVNEDLKQVYHELFDAALESYNAGKKKTRDKIPDYYEHIRQSKQEKLFHEAIFQIGNLSDCGCGSDGGRRAAEDAPSSATLTASGIFWRNSAPKKASYEKSSTTKRKTATVWLRRRSSGFPKVRCWPYVRFCWKAVPSPENRWKSNCKLS